MSIESTTHAFVVRIWSEERGGRAKRGELRGHITHAYTKERHSVHGIEDVVLFMRPFLAMLDVDLPMRSRLIMFLSSFGRRSARPRSLERRDLEDDRD